MDSKQAKRVKADENAKAYSLHRTVEAACSLLLDMAERNKLLAQ